MSEIKLGIGEIPLGNLCYWLNMRSYNREMIINYIKEIYSIDASKEVSNIHKQGKMLFDFSTNVYEKFKKENPPKKEDDGTRKWFNYYGRKRYHRFVDQHMWFSCDLTKPFCEILNVPIGTVTHHIYPLTYGGTNKLNNLIDINDIFHGILHKNPLEHIEKYCYQALDYLRYIIWNKYSYIQEKYGLKGLKVNKLIFDATNLAIENEMLEFYNLIQQEVGENHEQR